MMRINFQETNMNNITRRELLKTVGIGAIGFSLTGCSAIATIGNREKAKRKPNIVLVMADDQGWGDMGYYGHPVLKTPNFDTMAAEALRFDRFYAAAPVCSPTRGSVLTGRHPNRFGCFKWGHTLRPQEITIAESLKQAGYITGHFGKWHIGSVFKDSPVNPGNSGFNEWLSSPNYFDIDPILSKEGTAVQMQGESSTITVNAAIDFIGRHKDKPQPFFAVVWFGSPHVPHNASEEFGKAYEDQNKKKKNFYGEIAGMDAAVGKLRAELKAMNISDDTILWYCSDNGGLPNLGVTGGRGHKGQVYEGGLRVPAILEWPKRITKPKVTNVPCNTSDIYPTLLEIAGIKQNENVPLDGISLTALIDDKMKQRPKPMGFWDYQAGGVLTYSHEWMAELLELQSHGKEITDPTRLHLESGKIKKQYPKDTFPGHAAWLDWPWKLHRIENNNGSVKWELYDLANDADEKTNLIDRNNDIVDNMKDQLQEWQMSVVDSLNGKDYR